MKKSLKLAAALSLLGLTTFNTTAKAMDLSEMIPANWVKRTAEHVRQTISTSDTSYYVVQWGDTLSTIAEALNMPVDNLIGLNTIENPDLIVVGTVIYYNGATGTITADDRQGNVETVATDTHETVATQAVPEVVLAQADAAVAPVDLSPVAPAATTEDLSPVAPVETPATEQAPASVVTEEVAPAAVTEVASVEAPQVEVPEASSEAVAPTAETPAVETTPVAPVAEVVTEQPAPTGEATPAPATTTPAETTTTSSYSGVQSAAKEWIAQKESGGDYNAINPTGKYIGRYQLDASYLNGDHSPENQERVADEYVKNRYGTWEAAKAFWEVNGWY